MEAEKETWNNDLVANDTNNNFNTWEYENMSIFLLHTLKHKFNASAILLTDSTQT